MKTAVFVLARLGSTRLPRKSLAMLGSGRSIIEHLFDRLRLAKEPDLLALCTTTNRLDDELEAVAQRNTVECFRGHPEDLMDRCLNAARHFGVDFVVVAEGDEVFADAEFVDRLIARYRASGADFIYFDGLPIGAYVTGVRTEALGRLCELRIDPHSEGWTRYFTESDLFRVDRLPVNDAAVSEPAARLTMDYPEDLELIREIYGRLYRPDAVFSLRDVMALLRANPELLAINRHRTDTYAVHTANYPPIRLRQTLRSPMSAGTKGES